MLKFLRKKRQRLNESKSPEEFIKNIEFNKEKTNLDELFSIAINWIINLLNDDRD